MLIAAKSQITLREHSASLNRVKAKQESTLTQQKYTCEECLDTFGTKFELDIHSKQVHIGVAPWLSKYSCDVCSETFTQKISLNVHCMFKHGASRRYQCDKCDYEGPRLYHLKRHMKVHSSECEYLCSVCGKGLKTAQSYKNHMVLHTNDGRFTCNVCNKSYNQKSLYEDHVRSHCEERSYTCKYCDAAFKTYKHVACHIRAVHLEDKRFICDICGVRHMTGANLKTHMKKHKNISALQYAFHCSSCDANFRGINGLSAHMKVMHTINITQEDMDDSDKKFLTPHPTRRPQKLEYNCTSSTEVADGVDDGPGDEETADNPGGEMDDNIYVEGEHFTVINVNPEDIEFEIEERDDA